jgi:hypothetical protein
MPVPPETSRAHQLFADLFVDVRRYVFLGGFRCMVGGVRVMAKRQMRVMRRLHVIAGLVLLGCFAVVPRCMLVVFSSKTMVFAGFL